MIRKQAREYFPDEVDIFANLWLTAAGIALATAPEADDSEAAYNWWVALGGRMAMDPSAY